MAKYRDYDIDNTYTAEQVWNRIKDLLSENSTVEIIFKDDTDNHYIARKWYEKHSDLSNHTKI